MRSEESDVNFMSRRASVYMCWSAVFGIGGWFRSVLERLCVSPGLLLGRRMLDRRDAHSTGRFMAAAIGLLRSLIQGGATKE